MKVTWKTPEFWAALVGQVVSMVVLFGGLTAEQGAGMEDALKAISGGVLSILTILGYLGAQMKRKALAVELVTAGVYSLSEKSDGAEVKAAGAARDTLLAQL
jgi:hypothetical protein